MNEKLRLDPFRAVLFDVDGTLVDTLDVITEALGETYEKYAGARPSNEEIRALIGMPLRDQLRLYGMKDPSETQLQEMIDFTLDRCEAHRSLERSFPAALDTLRFCKERGLRTALVTSKNAEELRRFLPKFAGAEWVDATVCSSDVQRPKPDPESALLACRRLNVEPGEAVFIGDSVYDMRCARAGGVAHVAVSYGSAPKERLLEEEPLALFETPDALLNWARQSLMETPCQERN